MKKVYLVAYNTDPAFNVITFHSYISSLFPNHISDWFHYIHSSYLVVSTHDVNTLYKLIYPGVPGRHLLIVEIDPNNAQGWLPKDAWTWLQKYKAKG